MAWAGSKHSDAADVSPTHNTQLAPWEALPNPTALCAGRPPRGADVSTHLHQALPCQPWGRLSRTLILMFIEHVKGKKKINLITSLYKQRLEAAGQMRLTELLQVLVLLCATAVHGWDGAAWDAHGA